MKKIWKQKIEELDNIIYKSILSKQDNIRELYRKRDLLEDAFNRCG